jgi:hypothetical protein
MEGLYAVPNNELRPCAYTLSFVISSNGDLYGK